ncbi:shieldin complex subunit 3 isoform X2 [Brachionichthys hirsutus]|uniref:shieldin complex subunit 3 isoform X2 n=1 Tax=Brachionichthys hirsutus TaxID=412623 RepID=UPI00360528D9
MEDVVLHYQPGSDPGLRCLLETTEKLLRSFPCRTPPVFSPWFPAAADHHRPIRPAKAAPIITVSEDGPHRDTVQRKAQKPAGSPGKRSWSVLARKRPLLQSSQSLSEPFHQMVSVHRLHPRQRARWAISRHNCGAAGDIEQVWQAVSRSVQTSSLPTCNAYIQRERAEVWVFCDVVHSEQVGRFLKDELRLSGRISLSVPRLGNVFSM